MLVVALIVDGEIAVLQAELTQIVAVETGSAETVDPRQHSGNVFDSRAQWPLRHDGFHRLAALRRRAGRRRGRDRPLVGARKYRDRAVFFDPHRRFRTDEIEAHRAQLAGQQA